MKLKIRVVANFNKTFYCSIRHFAPYEMGFKNTSVEMRKLIIINFLENCLPKGIPIELLLTIRTVGRILIAYQEAGQICPKNNSGRPPQSTEKSRCIYGGLQLCVQECPPNS